jgi:hypothetical protein
MTSIKKTRTLETRFKRATPIEHVQNAFGMRFDTFDRSERVFLPVRLDMGSKINIATMISNVENVCERHRSTDIERKSILSGLKTRFFKVFAAYCSI